MDSYTEAKSMRLLTIYNRLLDGKIVKKLELAQEFGITQRSVQRDLESLRAFLAEEMLGRKIVYDSRERGYRFVQAVPRGLSNGEILAVCKILLESRSMRRDEMFPSIYRVDRVMSFAVTEEHFTPAYATRFQEGEFCKRIRPLPGP